MSKVVGPVLQIAAIVTGQPWLAYAAGGISFFQQKSAARKAERASRDAYNASLKDRLVMLDLQPDSARTLALGRVRAVEGIRRRWSSGTNSEKLTMIVSFAGHEIDGFETFYFDDVALTLDGSGWVQTEPWQKNGRRTDTVSLTLDGAGAGSVTLTSTPIAGTITATWRTGAGDTTTEGQCTVGGSGLSVTLTGGEPLANCYVSWQTATGESQARIRTYLGTAAQNVGADLAAEYPGKITSTDKFAGIALAVVDLLYDPDVFPQGIPKITALFRGAKVLDPRTSTTAWSENPALHAYHYARWANGWALPAGDVRTADIEAAADVCEVSTDFDVDVNGTPTVVTLPRYRCGIVIPSDADPRGAMDEIMETMAGRWGWSGGTWRMRAGHLAATSATLDASWPALRLGADGVPEQAAVVRLTNGVPRDAKVNRITGRCVDPDQRWQVLPFPAVQDAVLIAAEGAEYARELEYQGVNHIAHAQHLAKVAIRQNQAALRAEIMCNLNAWRLELFDVVELELPRYGMSGKTMEVLGSRWHPTEGVLLKTAEITAAIFEPVDELTGRDPAPNSSLPPPWQVETITGVAVTSGTDTLTDGSIITRTRVAWTSPTSQSILSGGQIEVQYCEAAAVPATDDWPSWMEQGSAAFATIPGLRTDVYYVFRVRAINGQFGVRGPWSAQVVHKVAAAPSVTAEGVFVEYSVDGSTAWHTTFTTGDLFARWKTGSAGAWNGPFRIVGETGAGGDYVDFIFKRSATAPATPTGATPAGWFDAPPVADGNPLWASTATKTAAGALVGVWSTPVQIEGPQGAPGTDGTRSAVVYAYQRATSAPALPSATVTYTFAGGGVTGLNNGWTSTIPGGTNPLYVTAATASAAASVATDTIAAGEWASAVVLAQDGAAGASTAIVMIYQRTATNSAPTLPSTTATYTFATGGITGLNNGWSATIPASGGGYLWTTRATALGTGSTDTISSGEWSAAVLLSQDGSAGAAGATATYAYQKVVSSTLPSAPSVPVGAPTAGNVSTAGVWYALPPSGGLASNEWLFQASGTVTGGTYTWISPSYLATFRVGNLAALSAVVDGAQSVSFPDPETGITGSLTVALAANTSFGATVGVGGISNSSTYAGVYGYNSSTTGGAGTMGFGYYGVRGAPAGAGAGVYGRASSTANSMGVLAAGYDGTTSSVGLRAQNYRVGSTGPYFNLGTALIADAVNGGTAFNCIGTSTFSGQITSTLATGTAPFNVTSTTLVANLNAGQLQGATWVSPGAIGSTTPNTGAFTTLSTTGLASVNSLRINQGSNAGTAQWNLPNGGSTASGKPGANSTGVFVPLVMNGVSGWILWWPN